MLSPHAEPQEGTRFSNIFASSINDLLVQYGRYDVGTCRLMQRSKTVGDLCDRLKAIRVSNCTFAHERNDSQFVPITCTLRPSNAACGHQGIVEDPRYRKSRHEQHSDLLPVNEKNAIATMEEAVAFLHALGVNCNEETIMMSRVAHSLGTQDSKANFLYRTRRDTPDAMKKLAESQRKLGEDNTKVLSLILAKMTALIRDLSTNKLEENPRIALPDDAWEEMDPLTGDLIIMGLRAAVHRKIKDEP